MVEGQDQRSVYYLQTPNGLLCVFQQHIVLRRVCLLFIFHLLNKYGSLARTRLCTRSIKKSIYTPSSNRFGLLAGR